MVLEAHKDSDFAMAAPHFQYGYGTSVHLICTLRIIHINRLDSHSPSRALYRKRGSFFPANCFFFVPNQPLLSLFPITASFFVHGSTASFFGTHFAIARGSECD